MAGLSDPQNSIKVAFTGTGNLIQVSTVDLFVDTYMVEPHDTNTGKTYGGKNTLSVANKVWLFWLPPPTTNFVETYSNKGKIINSFNLKELYLAGTSGEGATVTYNRS